MGWLSPVAARARVGRAVWWQRVDDLLSLVPTLPPVQFCLGLKVMLEVPPVWAALKVPDVPRPVADAVLVVKLRPPMPLV